MNSYYVHGGRDLKEGAMDSMWRLNLDELKNLATDPTYPVSWELISGKGKNPGKISHHTCTVMGDKMILLGGLKGDKQNSDSYIFDIACG